ncbi:Hypothetical protein A7982_02315 [Minicystis rosea]|nr:Hypothetical protein A7982_02315 [Minicystis rosea]
MLPGLDAKHSRARAPQPILDAPPSSATPLSRAAGDAPPPSAVTPASRALAVPGAGRRIGALDDLACARGFVFAYSIVEEARCADS